MGHVEVFDLPRTEPFVSADEAAQFLSIKRRYPLELTRSGIAGAYAIAKNGGDDETRTRDLCRDSGALIGFTTTYKTAGTAKGRLSR